MKTTIDLNESLALEAKKFAGQHGLTLKALVELGLRTVIDQQRDEAPFELRDASVDGGGLSPEFAGRGWAAIREAIYQDRGT